MSELSELNKAISALNDLWPLVEGEEREKVLRERNNLNDKASELAHKTLLEGMPELNDAIEQLKKVIQSAKDAKESVDQVAERINKVTDTIEKSVLAVGKVESLIAIL
jgi:exonuclease VII small subunit